MASQKSVIGHIQKMAGEIKQSGIHLHKVMLFGSYAKNAQHKWSDIDVALVADEFNGIGFDDTRLFSKILIKYPSLPIKIRLWKKY